MSISSTTRKAGPYTGNAVTTAFPFNFKVFASTDVVVTRTDLSAIETTLSLTTDYTVSLNANQDANPGGTVTLVTVPPAGYLVTISSAVPALQANTFTNNGGWYPAVMNDELDRLTILAQQNAEKVSRAVQVPISSSTDPNALIAQLNADAASAAASAAAAANSATAAANAVPAGSLGYTPVNKAGDTMTGNLALPGINVNGGGVITSLGSAATKTVGAGVGNVPLWDYLPLNSRNPQGAAYSVLVGDRGKLIDCTGTWALTMNSTTLGADFAFAVRNSGTGIITLTPAATAPAVAGTIDGVATLALAPGESCFVFSDGTNFETAGHHVAYFRTANTGMPPAGSANSVSHPLNRIPDSVRIELVCTVAEHGFGVGTVVEATGEWSGTGSASPIEIWKTSTEVGFNFSAGETFFLRDVTTGAAFIPTGANWVYRFVMN